MKQNMGISDRSIRLLIAVVLALLCFSDTVPHGWRVVLLAVSGVLALTAVAGICPLYKLLGFDTTNIDRKTKEGA